MATLVPPSTSGEKASQPSLAGGASPSPLAATSSATVPPSAASSQRNETSGSLMASRGSSDVGLTGDATDSNSKEVRMMTSEQSIEDGEELSEEARAQLIEESQQLQASLMQIVERVEAVKEEHDKLEGGNKFLQQYIGELIQTTKITSSSGKTKGKSSGRR